MTEEHLATWKHKLQSEKAELEAELSKIGRRNPDNPTDWEAKPLANQDTTSRDDIADNLEEMDEREMVEQALEARLKEVVHALDKMAQGTYGICEVGGETIETERLNVNPAATTCKAHLDAR